METLELIYQFSDSFKKNQISSNVIFEQITIRRQLVQCKAHDSQKQDLGLKTTALISIKIPTPRAYCQYHLTWIMDNHTYPKIPYLNHSHTHIIQKAIPTNMEHGIPGSVGWRWYSN